MTTHFALALNFHVIYGLFHFDPEEQLKVKIQHIINIIILSQILIIYTFTWVILAQCGAAI